MNKYIKLVIAVIMVALGVLLMMNEYYFWGVLVIVLAGLPIFLFFRHEYIWLAFWQLRKQNIAGAQKWLNKITNIETQLVKKQYGYYHYMLALTQGNTNINESEKLMKKAMQYGLSFAHDRAMANLSLAAAAASKGRKQEAEKLLNDAKKEDKQNMLSEQIKLMKDQMKKVNVGRNLQNPNVRNRGKFF